MRRQDLSGQNLSGEEVGRSKGTEGTSDRVRRNRPGQGLAQVEEEDMHISDMVRRNFLVEAERMLVDFRRIVAEDLFDRAEMDS